MAKKVPTIDGVTGQGTKADPSASQLILGGKPTDEEIVSALETFRQEAVQERKAGLNPRDAKWRENLDLYWNRFDYSKKADWQAREKLPEVPAFVDRFAAALTEAIVSQPSFYNITDPADREGDLTRSLKKMTDAWLSTSGRNATGHPLGFGSVFEEQVKLGAIMASSAAVTWKEDVPGGRVAIETVDPRMIWLDSTYRNLYRVRRLEVDRHDLAAMAKLKDSNGDPIYKLPELEQLVQSLAEEHLTDRERLTGTATGKGGSSSRRPVTIDEYIATVLGPDGKPIKDRGLYVVANERFLLRGPEDNPFWHGRDWLVFAPMSNTPLSVYGRTYMEDFGSLAKTFNELTNMILDAVFTSSMKAFAMVPSYLLNPGQATSGIHPNKTFLLEDGIDPKQFATALELGNLPPESMAMWSAIKASLQEASARSEVAMGQFAPKGRTSATEVRDVQQSGSSMLRSIASSLETRLLDPMLDLVWKTGLQHARKDDPMMAAIVGQEMHAALLANRRELIKRPLTFQARGLSSLLEKAQTLRNLLQMLQIVGSNELLLQQFLQKVDMGRLIDLLFDLYDIPMARLEITERERLMRSITDPLNAAKNGAPGAPGLGGKGGGGGAQREMASMMSGLGIGG